MALGRLTLTPSWDKIRFGRTSRSSEIDYQMVLSPLSLLVVETETVVPAVRHQNVPHIINDNSGRVVELAVPSSGGSESSDGLEIVRVENVDLIPWVYILRGRVICPYSS